MDFTVSISNITKEMQLNVFLKCDNKPMSIYVMAWCRIASLSHDELTHRGLIWYMDIQDRVHGYL